MWDSRRFWISLGIPIQRRTMGGSSRSPGNSSFQSVSWRPGDLLSIYTSVGERPRSMSWVAHRKQDLQMSFEGSQSFALSSGVADLDDFLMTVGF